MEQNYLREKIRELKRSSKIPFCYLSNKLNMNEHSFYNFMNEQKNVSSEKEQKLNIIIERLEKNVI